MAIGIQIGIGIVKRFIASIGGSEPSTEPLTIEDGITPLTLEDGTTELTLEG